MVNLPVAHGTIYRVSKVLYRCGIRRPFERMWQFDFPSPHLYYFSRTGLDRLFAGAGLRRERVVAMPTLRIAGHWARIRGGEANLVVAVAAYGASLLIAPVLAVLPADVECFFFGKVET